MLWLHFFRVILTCSIEGLISKEIPVALLHLHIYQGEKFLLNFSLSMVILTCKSTETSQGMRKS